MNENFTTYFLSMSWESSFVDKLSSIPYSSDTIIANLNDVFPKWGFEVTNIIGTVETYLVSINLYLPGRILSGIGKTTDDALSNIISSLVKKVNLEKLPNNISKNVEQTPSSLNVIGNSAQEKKLSTDDIINEINQKKEATNNTSSLFDGFNFSGMFSGNQQTPTEQNTNQTSNNFVSFMPLPDAKFGSTEQQKTDQEFLQHGTIGINEPQSIIEEPVKEKPVIKQPTPSEVNPTNRIYTNSDWDSENGRKLKKWIKKHEIHDEEQMGNWFKLYCGLDYSHFNPEWTDRFIEWMDQKREQPIC